MNNINDLKDILPEVFTSEATCEMFPGKKAVRRYVERLAEKGLLIRLKQNAYCFAESPDLFAISNGLVSYSYISFETALFHYGMIPERTSLIMSVTASGRPKKYRTPIGEFVYWQQNAQLFSMGMSSKSNSFGRRVLIANREKALCDTLYRSRMEFSKMNPGEFEEFLFDGLRLDEEHFESLRLLQVKCLVPLYRTKAPLMLLELMERK